MHDEKHPSEAAIAERNQPLGVLRITNDFIVEIHEYRRRFLERYSVLRAIRFGFIRIPLKVAEYDRCHESSIQFSLVQSWPQLTLAS